jgi:hypothetical protein
MKADILERRCYRSLNAPRMILMLVFMIICHPLIKAQCTNNWTGTAPAITFIFDGTTLTNYSIGFTNVGCFASITFTYDAITVTNGSFSQSVINYPNSGNISGSLSLDGNSFSGTYTINLAYLHPIYGYPVSCGTITGTWIANPETPRPVANAGSDVTICKGTDVTLTGTGGTSYSWTGGITNGIAFKPDATATYTVTVTAANGCMDTDDVTVTVDDCTGVTDLFETSQILNIFPNPVHNEFTIVIGSREPRIKISVISANSKVVCSNEYKNVSPGTFTDRINLSGQTPGIYFVKIVDGKTTISKKIILE